MIRTKGEGGEKEREATEEDGEGGKEAEDGDKSNGSMGGKRDMTGYGHTELFEVTCYNFQPSRAC